MSSEERAEERWENEGGATDSWLSDGWADYPKSARGGVKAAADVWAVNAGDLGQLANRRSQTSTGDDQNFLGCDHVC